MLLPRKIKTRHGATRPIPMLMEWVWSHRGRVAFFWLFHALGNIFLLCHNSNLCIKIMILETLTKEQDSTPMNAKNYDWKLHIYCMKRKSRLQCLQGNIG